MTTLYDPEDRLISLTQGGTTTQFAYIGPDIATEFNGSTAQILRRYVPGSGEDEPVVWFEGSDGSHPRWLLQDHQGSVIAVTDMTGGAIALNTFSDYGQPGSGNLGRYQYTGQFYLPEVGVYDYKARLYSPTQGRFMQTDPVGYKDGLNWYDYVHNDPVNQTDPSGDDGWEVAWGVAQVIGGGASVVGGTVVAAGGAITEGASGGLSTPVSVPAVGLGAAAVGGGIVVVGNGIKDIIQGTTSQSSSGRPMQGEPGSTVDNGRGQGRRYGPDGYPETDTDKGHDHKGAGDPHSHDWGRPTDGSPPTHQDRGPPRPVKRGDPVAPSNPPPKPPPKQPNQN